MKYATCHPDREARCVGLCRLCYKKAQHAKHASEVNARKRLARIANGDHIRALARASARLRVDKVRTQRMASYRRNREATLAKWKAARGERNREADRARYHSNPKRKAAQKKQAKHWKKAHPEVALACAHRRRARLLGTNSPGVTAAQWRQILRAAGNACVYCARTGVPLQRDHVKPISRGGIDAPSNVVPACGPCNQRKGVGKLPFVIQPRNI